MNMLTAAKIAVSVYPILKNISTTRAAIKASRAERKFWEDLSARMTPTKAEPIRVKCQRLA